MEFTTYVRKPFTVEAVEITSDNIEEISLLVGELKRNEDGIPYIIVDPKKVPNIERVYLGFFMTKMRDNVRCYSGYVFKRQFTELVPEIQPWVDYMNNRGREKVAP